VQRLSRRTHDADPAIRDYLSGLSAGCATSVLELAGTMASLCGKPLRSGSDRHGPAKLAFLWRPDRCAAAARAWHIDRAADRSCPDPGVARGAIGRVRVSIERPGDASLGLRSGVLALQPFQCRSQELKESLALLFCAQPGDALPKKSEFSVVPGRRRRRRARNPFSRACVHGFRAASLRFGPRNDDY
jgi:hypothetical protein